jgi:hypothetical protein
MDKNYRELFKSPKIVCLTGIVYLFICLYIYLYTFIYLFTFIYLLFIYLFRKCDQMNVSQVKNVTAKTCLSAALSSAQI